MFFCVIFRGWVFDIDHYKIIKIFWGDWRGGERRKIGCGFSFCFIAWGCYYCLTLIFMFKIIILQIIKKYDRVFNLTSLIVILKFILTSIPTHEQTLLRFTFIIIMPSLPNQPSSISPIAMPAYLLLTLYCLHLHQNHNLCFRFLPYPMPNLQPNFLTRSILHLNHQKNTEGRSHPQSAGRTEKTQLPHKYCRKVSIHPNSQSKFKTQRELFRRCHSWNCQIFFFQVWKLFQKKQTLLLAPS